MTAVGRPRFSVIHATTPSLSLHDALEVYRRAGADGVGIAESSVGDVAEDAEALRSSGLELTGCFLATDSILPPVAPTGFGRPELNTPRLRVDNMAQAIRRLAPLKPRYFYALTGPRGAHAPAEARSIVVDGLRELSAVTAEIGSALLIELFHETLDSWSYLHTIPDAIDLLERVDRPNVGLACDVWHLGLGPEIADQLREHASRIVSMHIDDWRDPTRSPFDRVLPGDGIADVPSMLGSLEDGGFDGWYELEILSDDGTYGDDYPDSLWKRDPFELVHEGREKFLAAWNLSRA